MTEEPEPLVTVWVLYENPRDFPGQWVVRVQRVVPPLTIVIDRDPWFVGDSLRDARKSLPRGLTRIGRHPNDDPAILETWL